MEDYIEVEINNRIYPDKLRKIKNSPRKLYMRGNYDLLNSNSIAVVGSRECTSYGFREAYEYSKELSKQGICIVSGLAEGIDTASHLGGMHQIGKTIAVLGTGLNRVFPEENKILAESIIKNGGLIISEYELNQGYVSANFPKRNRIMTGISKGVLIIEAKNKSGTLITARLAKEQNKKIFCLPGNIDNKNSSGTNKLIKNGAKFVIDVNDILDELIEKPKEDEIKYKVEDEYRKVYDILTDKPAHINEISKKAKISMAETSQILTMLEIEGMIKSLPNNEFQKG